MINPSEFNRRVTLKSFTYVQGDAGGLSAVLNTTKEVWAKVENLSGSTRPTQGQIKSDADYKITIRYNPVFTTDWILYYDGMNMKIKNVDTDSEGYKRFMVLYCSVSINQEAVS